MKPEKKPRMTALQRKYNDAGHVALPPGNLPTGECWCTARYLDTEGGHDAHLIVFGHQPGDKLADVTEVPERDDSE